MSREKQIWIAGIVFVGLAGVAYMQVRKDSNLGTTKAKSVDLPDIKGSDDVDKITVKNADKSDVVLEKKGDKWMLSKPVSAPANQQSVKSLLDNLKDLKTKDAIADKPSDDEVKEYQLDDAHAVKIETFKGAD